MIPAFDTLESPALRGLARDLHADGWQVSCERDAGDVVRVAEVRHDVYHDGDVYLVLDTDGEVLGESTEFGAIVGTLYGRMQTCLAEQGDTPRRDED